MPRARENSRQSIKTREYDIVGNVLRAYYGADGALICVVDLTISDFKPNVLLVLTADGDRKWDDILENDFDMNLETVRPRRDNKYQKLDIAYDGLNAYDDLIRAYDSGADIDDAIAAVLAVRNAAVRENAYERQSMANQTAEKSRETILRANNAVDSLQSQLRQLRTKHTQQKKEIGRVPTKQSASKILRTEAQIDATNEKLKRAKRRLTNAQKRLVTAEDDAESARQILAMVPENAPKTQRKSRTVRNVPAKRVASDVAVSMPAPVPATIDQQTTDLIDPEQEAEIMADENVKPLFDRDPEILDEEIAFKPIEFTTKSAPTSPIDSSDAPSPVDAPSPLSFAPPVSDTPTSAPQQAQSAPVSPVLDSMRAVDSDPVPRDVAPIEPKPVIDGQNYAKPAPMPEVSPAPRSSDFRPVSPITGGNGTYSNNSSTDGKTRRPTLVYYIMLFALIVMSIFTLWLYQKNASNTVPDITAAVKQDIAPQFVETVVPTEPEPVEATVEPEPVIVPPMPAEPDEFETIDIVPAISESEITSEPEIEPEPVDETSENPFIPTTTPEPEPVVAPEPEPVAEPVVNKPAYNVSQNEKMFVAAPDYDTDVQPYYSTNDSEYYVAQNEPVAPSYDIPSVASENTPPQVVTSEIITCDDGSMPNIDGCCAGEIFTDMEDGTFACCSPDGIECFAPIVNE